MSRPDRFQKPVRSVSQPTKITFGSNGTIEYIYNSVGQKVLKKVTEGSVVTTTDYLSGFQYKNNVLTLFPHAEGYVNFTASKNGTYKYVFNYTDHLGNVRLSYSLDSNVLKILEENHYYAFGLKHTNYNTDGLVYQVDGNDNVSLTPVTPLVGSNYKYKYNGKELQEELGLNMYDYGARNYDPSLGRWMNIDPKAEVSRRWSPYNYCYNNPMYFVDPDGMLPGPGDEFKSLDEAANDFGKEYNGLSIMYNLEVATLFYSSKDKQGNITYSYIVPEIGGGLAADLSLSDLEKGQTFEAHGHSHAGDMATYKIDGKLVSDNNEFSDQDISMYKNENEEPNIVNKPMVGYVATSDGGLRKFDPNAKYPEHTGKYKVPGDKAYEINAYDLPIAKDLPSDKKSGVLRQNTIEPSMPKVLPKNFNPKDHEIRDDYKK